MNHLVQLSIQLYAALLHLYPISFRLEFEEEMRAVFAEAAAEATKGGFRTVAALWFREVWDWPRSLLREIWFDLRRQRGLRMNGSQHHSLGTPAWTAIGLVMLPGLFVFGSSWLVDARQTVPILGLALCAALCLVGLIRTHYLPSWSYPTLGISFGLLVRPLWPLGILLAPQLFLGVMLSTILYRSITHPRPWPPAVPVPWETQPLATPGS